MLKCTEIYIEFLLIYAFKFFESDQVTICNKVKIFAMFEGNCTILQNT